MLGLLSHVLHVPYAAIPVVAITVLVVIYLRLKWAPFKTCSSCGGKGFRQGALKMRTCGACRGSGQRVRLRHYLACRRCEHEPPPRAFVDR
jgi:hypothetical protein